MEFAVGTVGEDCFERGEGVVVVFCKIPVHSGVCEDSFDVFECGGEIEYVVAVVCLDAVGVFER